LHAAATPRVRVYVDHDDQSFLSLIAMALGNVEMLVAVQQTGVAPGVVTANATEPVNAMRAVGEREAVLVKILPEMHGTPS
jgi:hypothetical protein